MCQLVKCTFMMIFNVLHSIQEIANSDITQAARSNFLVQNPSLIWSRLDFKVPAKIAVWFLETDWFLPVSIRVPWFLFWLWMGKRCCTLKSKDKSKRTGCNSLKLNFLNSCFCLGLKQTQWLNLRQTLHPWMAVCLNQNYMELQDHVFATQ